MNLPKPILTAAWFVLVTDLMSQGATHAQTSYQLLKTFEGQGGNPTSLIQGSDEELYGTLEYGGQKGEGVLFRLNKDAGEYRSLHDFTGYRGGEDGSGPEGIIEGNDGVLYGTTRTGGHPLAPEYPTGSGTLFKVNNDGSGYAVLHRFPETVEDGVAPCGGLVLGPDGALYGTTQEGGTNKFGTVFRLSRNGAGYAVLHHFGSEADGATPRSGLLAASDGWLYGTTEAGGNGWGHNGTVFKLRPDGSAFRVLHSFPEGPSDGRFPRSRLLEGPDGALYGTTQNGGKNDTGAVFKLNKDGRGYRVLHSLSALVDSRPDPQGLISGVWQGVPTRFSAGGEGSTPNELMLAGKGVLYGTAQYGGKNGGGTAFKLNANGSGFTILHNFPATEADGQEPCANLLQGSDGALYGMTRQSHTNSFAILFKISLPP